MANVGNNKTLLNFSILKAKKEILAKIIEVQNKEGKDTLDKKITFSSIYTELTNTYIEDNKHLLEEEDYER